MQAKLSEPQARPTQFAGQTGSLDDLIAELYLRAFSRPPTDAELRAARDYVTAKESAAAESDEARRAARQVAFEDLAWAIINTKEFLFNH
jgi:hypothetical protein